MATDGITSIVLQEFRLRAPDTDGEAARLVAAMSGDIEPPVPLLTSIEDTRDVATVRALHAGETTDPPGHGKALDRLVASWEPLKQYGPRMIERSVGPPSYYRLAVTESGINNADTDPLASTTRRLPDDATATTLGLLWIGIPTWTYAGLMILLGSGEAGDAVRPDPREWPLPLSRYLGVRIYDSK